MKILIVRTSSLGDIIHTLPVAADIKRQMPDAQLHWVVEESFQDVCKLSRYIDVIHMTAFRRWRKHLFEVSTWREIAKVKRELTEEYFDCVIDTQGLVRSGLVASWTKADTFGYSKETLREPMARFFYRHTIPMDEMMGTVRRYRRMVAESMKFPYDEASLAYGLRPMERPSCSLPQRFVALFVSTARDAKHWQPERWRELIERLWQEKRWEVVLFWASASDKQRADLIATGLPSAHVLPKMRIAEVASVIDQAVMGIGVDTGLTHLCAALAKPTLGIWLDTNPQQANLVGEGRCLVLGGEGAQVAVDNVFREAIRMG